MVLAILTRLFLGDCPEFWEGESGITILLIGLFCRVFTGDRVVETLGILFVLGWLCFRYGLLLVRLALWGLRPLQYRSIII
jgi:hypothetical protein